MALQRDLPDQEERHGPRENSAVRVHPYINDQLQSSIEQFIRL